MFGRKKRTSIAKDDNVFGDQSPYWRCASCGTVFKKKPEAIARLKAFEVMEQLGAKVTDLARCATCGATFDAKDVYSGKYDCDI